MTDKGGNKQTKKSFNELDSCLKHKVKILSMCVCASLGFVWTRLNCAHVHYSMSKLSWHDRKRGKWGMHLVLNRKQFSHVNPSQLVMCLSTNGERA